MKKLFIAFMLCIASMSFAQVSGHMKFMGIPMEGTVEQFVSKLKAKGMVYMGTNDGVTLLQGEFAATKSCVIGVTKMEDANKVNMVAVIFPSKETWGSLSEQYYTLKDMLTEKYGEPESTEQFKRDNLSDFMKFHGIYDDEATFISEYTCDNGYIQLSMKKMDTLKCSVFLRYIDNSNAEETRQRIMDDL